MSAINNNDNITTHPSAYRDAMNGKVCQKINNEIKGEQQSQKQSQSSQDWDLYPQVIRKIENEGTEKDVKQLHKIEHTLSN